MKIIDAHAHIFKEKNYTENLIKTMDINGIEKCCISGLDSIFNCLNNKEILDKIKKFPDRLIGAYFIRPGISKITEIEQAYSDGFKLLKVTIPTKSYDSEEFFEYWNEAQKLKMPILFHTGIVTTFSSDLKHIISSWYMHPMRLETITNSFPDLKIIIAHLGVHWNHDAAELARMRKNVYIDLTGEPNGWRIHMDNIGLKNYLWWTDAFKKIIFGTDVHYSKIKTILEQDIKRLDYYNIDNKTRSLILHKNIENLIGDS